MIKHFEGNSVHGNWFLSAYLLFVPLFILDFEILLVVPMVMLYLTSTLASNLGLACVKGKDSKDKARKWSVGREWGNANLGHFWLVLPAKMSIPGLVLMAKPHAGWPGPSLP